MPIEISMPALSPTMTQGTLASWLVKEGDVVASGDVIAEIETDKATMEVEAVDDGTVAKILVPAGSEGVAVNAVIALLVEEGEVLSEDESLPAAPTPPTASPAPAPAAPAVARGPSLAIEPEPVNVAGATSRIKASPLAKRMAAQQGLQLSHIQGSGPGGRVIKRDVEAAAQAVATAAPAAPATLAAAPLASDAALPVEVQRPSTVRKIIAKRLVESKFSSPHFYVTMDMELDALLALRSQINADPDRRKVSANDMFVMACGRALKAVPQANAAWVDEMIHQYLRADICVAVALDGGLVTPVVKGADTKSLSQISAEAGDLITRAREGKLLPEEMQGGSFSISNMGMMGVKQFTAIINPPQGAILAVGAGEKRAVVKNDALAIATVMTCTLSADHRVIDGAEAARFTAYLSGVLGDIRKLVL